MDILLAKYTAGEADAVESAEAEQWVAAHETNEKYAGQLHRIWEECGKAAFTGSIDEWAAWQNFRHRLVENPGTTAAWGWLKVAAIVLIMAGLGAGIYTLYHSKSDTPEVLHYFSGNKVRTDTLPDGSIARLSENSVLSYPPSFRKDQRRLRLSGQCFFNVLPDRDRPFVIDANDVTVKVIGTSFTIRASGSETEIQVMTGVVRVIKHMDSVQLSADQKMTIFLKDSSLVTQDTSLSRQREIVRDVIRDLIDQGIVVNRQNIESLELSARGLILNRQKEPEKIYQAFRAKYLKGLHCGIYYGDLRPPGQWIYVARNNL